MFYEVRVLDPKGKVQKVIPGKALTRMYWQRISEVDTSVVIKPKPIAKKKKKKIGLS